jgi:hypothetical protein
VGVSTLNSVTRTVRHRYISVKMDRIKAGNAAVAWCMPLSILMPPRSMIDRLDCQRNHVAQ